MFILVQMDDPPGEYTRHVLIKSTMKYVIYIQVVYIVGEAHVQLRRYEVGWNKILLVCDEFKSNLVCTANQ